MPLLGAGAAFGALAIAGNTATAERWPSLGAGRRGASSQDQWHAGPQTALALVGGYNCIARRNMLVRGFRRSYTDDASWKVPTRPRDSPVTFIPSALGNGSLHSASAGSD